MADISSWSPVDASNNVAPPNGWPENMLPSGVNDCGRAMMGAIRRHYDQTISGSLSLPYLPIGGGILTGTVSAPQYNLNGIVFALHSSGYTVITDPNGETAISLGGPAGSNNSYYRNAQHIFQDNAGTTQALIDTTGKLIVNNDFSAVDIIATTNITAGGTVAASTVTASGNIVAGAYRCDALLVIDTGVIGTPGGPATVPFLCNEGGGAGIQLHSQNSRYLSDAHAFQNAAASASAPVSASAFNLVSDRRLKEDIEPAPQGLPEVLKLNPVSFKRLGSRERETGFVAQDVAAALPQAVSTLDLNGEATLAINDMPILAALVNAVQEISKRLESLEAR